MITAEVRAEVSEGRQGGASGVAGPSSPSVATPCPRLPFWPQAHPAFPFSGLCQESPRTPLSAGLLPPPGALPGDLSALWAPSPSRAGD